MNAQRENELQLTQEAADWFTRLEAGERDCHGAFLDWVRQSPMHVREFLAVSHLSRRLLAIDPEHRRNPYLLATQGAANIVPLQNKASARTAVRSQTRMHWWSSVAAVAALVGITIAFAPWTKFGAERYETGLGEQRIFKLPDGSLIHLNTQSVAEVRYRDNVRSIELVKGEALFTVAHQSGRPFRVAAGNTLIEAVGTQFNVYRRASGTAVAVVEGRVRVSSGADSVSTRSDTQATHVHDATSPKQTLLSAGEGARIDSQGTITDKVPTVDQAIAWRQRLLEFKDTTLADAAAEFNRYNRMQIEVQGANVRTLQVTGFFNVDNPEGLLQFLGKDATLNIVRDGNNVTIRAR